MRTRCYSDYLAHALELCEHWPNLRLVFAGAITFKEKADKVNNPRELVVGLPLERLLIETDGHTSDVSASEQTWLCARMELAGRESPLF